MRRLPLKVMLWGKEIGRLAWDAERRTTYFLFSPEAIGGSLDIAPLVAPITSPKARMPFWGDDDRLYQKLPSFLADSLPDDWGNQLFDYWRTSHGISNSDITPLEKLSFIGSRGMGALEFVPEMESWTGKGDLKIESLISIAQRIFLEREKAAIMPEESLTLQRLIAVGTSAGGRQPKAIIARNNATGEIRSGQTAQTEGFNHYIIKFGDAERSAAETEMAYYEMARLAGIDMMPSELIVTGGQKHFLTQRFDRQRGEKLHIQTLAALWPDAKSYDDLMWVCRRMRLPDRTGEEVFRRLVFNVLANNTDDHNKNFCFIMNQMGKWALAPAYDMTFIFNKGGYLPQEDRCFSLNGKIADITREDVLLFAQNNGIKNAPSIINDVAGAICSFRTLAEKHGVAPEWTGRIEACLTEHLKSWGLARQSASIQYEKDGQSFTDIRIETAYRGNYHLFVTIDGNPRKFVIRRKTALHETISQQGTDHIDLQTIQDFLTDLS